MSNLRDFVFNLAAGVPQYIKAAGDFFAIIEATDDVYLRVDGGQQIERGAGMAQTGEYSSLEITSLVVQTVRIVAGYGFVYDNRVQHVINVTANVTPSTQVVALADVAVPAAAAVLIAAANANRNRLHIKHNSGNGVNDLARIGHNLVGAAIGVELVPGEGLTLDTQAAVYAYNTGAAAITISLLEENTP